jgi:hypothetical protein
MNLFYKITSVKVATGFACYNIIFHAPNPRRENNCLGAN